jgi:hypothetical protein
MTHVVEKLRDFAGWIAKGKIALPDVEAIPPEQCLPAGCAGDTILRDRDYFHVTINELFLSDARFGLATYDPLVLATTSFLYGGKQISVPSIVGPSLLQKAGQRLPQGIVLQDTTVVGPYPFRGGTVTISLVFYRVRCRDYAKELLRVVENVCGAIGPAADMSMLSKVSGPLIDGLNDLVGMGETEPIAGHRIELGPLKPAGFKTCYSALIEANSTRQKERLLVDAGRLKISSSLSPEKYTAGSYVLYSVTKRDTRDDESTLPFYPIYERALRTAATGGDEAWKAAKASFSELWQQMIASPDLTKGQANVLLEAWKKDLLAAHDAAQNISEMSMDERTEKDPAIRGAASLLDL